MICFVFRIVFSPYLIATWLSEKMEIPEISRTPERIASRTAFSLIKRNSAGTFEISVTRNVQTCRTTAVSDDWLIFSCFAVASIKEFCFSSMLSRMAAAVTSSY